MHVSIHRPANMSVMSYKCISVTRRDSTCAHSFVRDAIASYGVSSLPGACVLTTSETPVDSAKYHPAFLLSRTREIKTFVRCCSNHSPSGRVEPAMSMWFSRQFWEAFVSTILPTLSLLHVSWMFRMNGISSMVPFADWVYSLTFDTFTRVVPKSPGTPRTSGSSLWRVLVYNVHRVILWFTVRSSQLPELCIRLLSDVPSLPESLEPQSTASSKKADEDWENPEIVGRCKR